MQNSTMNLLALFGLSGPSTYTAVKMQSPSTPLNGLASPAMQMQSRSNGVSSPSIWMPQLAFKKIELPKQDPSLPDWAVLYGDMGLKFYRAVCCPEGTRH